MPDREKRLIMVTSVNNNKFYNMRQLDYDTFEVEYGRVDKTKTRHTYPMRKWGAKYNEKIRKGYKDVTELHMEDVSTPTTTMDVSGHDTTGLLRKLQQYATGSIRRNYSVTSEKVTQLQIDAAQHILNNLSALATNNYHRHEINDGLLDLYQTVPRLMADVRDHLLEPDGFIDVTRAKRVVRIEQENIDVMAQQVSSRARGDTTKSTSLNITIETATDQALRMLRNKAQGQGGEIIRAYSVLNEDTQRCFADNLSGAKSGRDKVDIFWHGSRNENWLSIVDMGLLIRPTGVLTTGSMFGNGIYFADKFQKSKGYTSARGSYWAHGKDSTGFMAIFNVHVGRQLQLSQHERWCYDMNRTKLARRGDYDSIFANSARGFLMNSEYVVYDASQVTIAYLVEIA